MESEDRTAESLRDAITWCEHRAAAERPRESLRSDSIRPSPLEPSPAAVVESVSGSRQFELRHGSPLKSPTRLGRVLVFAPALDTRCGTCESETQGFFDIFGAPPWDTWVSYVEAEPDRSLNPSELEALAEAGAHADLPLLGCLLAYVPAVFVDLVERATEVDPMGSITWLSNCPAWFAPEARSALESLAAQHLSGPQLSIGTDVR